MSIPAANIAKAVGVAIALFLVGAVAEGLITVWIFRRYGVCPFQKDMKPQQ